MTESREQLRARFHSALVARCEAIAQAFTALQGRPLDERQRSDVLGELHTLKGEARMLGLSALAVQAHELETAVGEGAPPAHCVRSLEEMRQYLRQLVGVAPVAAPDARVAGTLLEATLFELAQYAETQAQRAGKSVDVEVSAPGVELSLDLIEGLRPVLLHVLENAVAHGLEAPAERGGKPETGRLSLRVELRGSRLLVTCEDDGRGIDSEAVRAALIARGLCDEGSAARLSREELFERLFEPGLSTKADVSLVSGRGVGLDVVRRQVRALSGEIALESEPGRGTRFVFSFSVELPAPLPARG